MTHNNERDEPAPPYLVGVTDDFPGGNDDDLTEWAFERGIEYQKWHSKPKRVTTVAELDALPGGSIIRDAKGIGWQKYNKISDKPTWLPATRQEGFYFSSNLVDSDRTPATVLHVGSL